MIKFDVKKRFTGEVKFTAEIDCADDAPLSIKLGLAVKWAIKARADLAGAYLAGADLAGANLAGANLADANLAGANLAGANLARAYLARAYLAGADLARADLAGANLADANLAGANLAGANLADANLARANLAGANLAGANLADANLAGANLAGAYLAGADLAGANLARADLADANLAGADLARAYLARANLARADLADANLAGANLARADLARAYLARAYLAGADLAGANLARARNVPTDTEQTDPPEPYERKPAAERYAERAARFRERNPDVPVIPDLDRQILNVIDRGEGKLDMGSWHSCETTHCRAGWAVTLGGDAGKALEAKHGPENAGRMIYIASTGRVPHFYASDAAAMEDIRRCAAEQAPQSTTFNGALPEES